MNLIAGIANIVLVYVVGRRVLERHASAIIAAAILATAPAHVMQSGQAGSALLTVTCVLAWSLGMLGVTREDQGWRIFLSMAAAGAAVYSWLGAVVTAPACLVITLVLLLLQGMRRPAPYLAAIAGLAVAWLPLAAWSSMHAGAFVAQVNAHSLYDTTRLNPLQGLRELLSYVSLTERSAVYWDYFSPSFLFFSGQVFWWPIILLLPFGLYGLVADRPNPRTVLLLLGFLTSPLTAVLLAQRYTIARAMVMVPFAALVAAAGAERLWTYLSASTMRPTVSDASRRSGL